MDRNVSEVLNEEGEVIGEITISRTEARDLSRDAAAGVLDTTAGDVGNDKDAIAP